MKAQILKIAGVKTEKEFYKKFPSEEAFMKKHGKELKKAQGGASVNGADFFGNTTSNYGYDPNASNSFVEAVGKAKGGGKNSTLSNVLGKLAPLAGTIIGGVQDIGQTNKDIKKMSGYANISDVIAKGTKTKPEPFAKKIDYNSMRSQTVNPLGVGTNYLFAENGAEIANTFAPNTIYTDMGYEPLNDSNVKQFQNGGFAASPFSNFAGIAGGLAGNLGSAMGKGTGRGGSWAQTLGALGNVASMVPGVGTLAGIALNTLPSLAGGLFGDAPQQNELQMAQDKLASNLGAATLTSGAQSFQGQNSSFMEDGGWVSNDWMPQTITKFGEYNMDELLAPPHDADMLRSGGHLAQVDYTAPSARAMYTGRTMDDGGMMHSTNMMFDTDRYPRAEYGTQMAMGGDLQVHRGEAETMSYNPFLPNGGETVMFRGPSHDNGGMPISFGQNGVEVEGGEPAIKMQDGGEQENLVVYGNMVIPSYGAEEIGDPKAKGKKFKNYVADLSKVEAKQNKIINKSTNLINNTDAIDPFDQLTLNSGRANVLGANMKLKDIADKKMNIASVQNAILDTAEEHGIVSDDLAKGKIVQDKEAMKKARFGAKMETAQKGKTIKYDPEFSNFIDQAMMLEQANSTQAGDYRGGADNYGTGTFSDYDTPEKAKQFYYKEYWSKVKDLPAGLRTRALQMAINTGDPYGELMVAAGKMGLDERRSTLKERKDKNITGNKTWETNKADILKTYKEDPQGFLAKLDNEQDRYYNSYIANNPSSINPNTRKEFFDDYTGLARYASQPYISNTQSATAPSSAPYTPVSTPVTSAATSPTELWQIPKGERKAIALANGIKNYSGTKAQNEKLISVLNQSTSAPASALSPVVPESVSPVVGTNAPSFFNNTAVAQQRNLSPSDLDQYIPQDIPGTPSTVESPNPNAKKKALADSPLFDFATSALQSAYPFIRSTAQQPLDPAQLGPEMMALGLNKLQPVQLKLYNPTPQAQPYRISLQDKRNEVIAQQQAASKASYGNPAAQAMIAAQAARALSDISGEENRINQAETMRAAEANRGLMNEAQRVNIGLYDQQYARQSEAESKTKTQAIEIAKSVADKIAKNKLENKQQAISENMYPAFGYTKSGIAYKDPRYTTLFNNYGSGKTGMGGTGELEAGKDYSFNRAGKVIGIHNVGKEDGAKNGKKVNKKGPNSNIVKAIKGL